ncbi:MAG: RsmD family RNA methyltransferase [Rikenellaceae bacterium]
MRIISGTHRRRPITPPAGFRARPTTDFAKENLFNVINNSYEFEDLRVLDLFSGTGSISYEFASRGAARVVSVEMNPTHHRFIQNTSREMGLLAIEAVCTNTFVYLRSSCGGVFDIVFADPPYDLENIETLPDAIFSAGILSDIGMVIVEHGSTCDFSLHPRFLEVRRYGSVNFSLFE